MNLPSPKNYCESVSEIVTVSIGAIYFIFYKDIYLKKKGSYARLFEGECR